MKKNVAKIEDGKWSLSFSVLRNLSASIEVWDLSGTVKPLKITSFSQKIVLEPDTILPMITY